MLHGNKVSLRGRIDSDIPILHAGLFEDVEGYSISAGTAWRPLVLGEKSRYSEAEPNERFAPFSVVDRERSELLGVAVLWGIDTHNRMAHLGVSLLPSYRGRGFGTDVVSVLCRYGFSTLGLHRLQLETLSDNHSMIRVAERCGFIFEGRNRESSWANGAFADDVSYGILASEWSNQHAASSD